MVFVPVIIPQAQEASARARDLARRLEETIATFERQYPGTSPGDIRQAVRLATGLKGASRAAPRAMAILAGAISLAVGLFAFLARESGGLGGEGNPALPWVVFGVVAGVAGVVVALKRMR